MPYWSGSVVKGAWNKPERLKGARIYAAKALDAVTRNTLFCTLSLSSIDEESACLIYAPQALSPFVYLDEILVHNLFLL